MTGNRKTALQPPAHFQPARGAAAPADLADASQSALRDSVRRGADARAARERVCATYSLEAMVRVYETLYTEGVA